jgi:spore maturation protein CgeB
VTFRDGAELRAHVERLLADPDERARIAARGHELVLARHTFAHRVDALLDAVAPLIGGVLPEPLAVTE